MPEPQPASPPKPVAPTLAPDASGAMLLFVLIVATLYFGKEVLVPVTLALLLGLPAGAACLPAAPGAPGAGAVRAARRGGGAGPHRGGRRRDRHAGRRACHRRAEIRRHGGGQDRLRAVLYGRPAVHAGGQRGAAPRRHGDQAGQPCGGAARAAGARSPGGRAAAGRLLAAAAGGALPVAHPLAAGDARHRLRGGGVRAAAARGPARPPDPPDRLGRPARHDAGHGRRRPPPQQVFRDPAVHQHAVRRRDRPGGCW